MLVVVQLLRVPCHKRNQLGGCYYGTNYQISHFPPNNKEEGSCPQATHVYHSPHLLSVLSEAKNGKRMPYVVIISICPLHNIGNQTVCWIFMKFSI